MNATNVEDRALELIKAAPKGVLQSDLWKDLDIDSRKCSRVVAKLEADGKIKRTWETVSGTRTYRLSYVPPKKEAPKKEYRFDLIMAEDEVAPCVGCTYECEPDYCPDLGNWIELLAKEEAARLRKIGAKEAAEPKRLPEPRRPSPNRKRPKSPKSKSRRLKRHRRRNGSKNAADFSCVYPFLRDHFISGHQYLSYRQLLEYSL